MAVLGRLQWFLLLGLLSIIDGQTVPILTANPDGMQRGDTWAELQDTFTLSGDSTLCLRFNIAVFRLLTAVVYLFDAQDSDNDPISFEVYFEKIRTKYGGYGRFYALPNNLATNTWYHYCQVRDVTKGEGRVFLNGEMIVNESVSFQRDPRLRRLFVGQDEFQPPYSLSGQLAQLNVWGSALSDDRIKMIASCEDVQEGDVVRWSQDWKTNNVNFTQTMLGDMIVPPWRTMFSLKSPSISVNNYTNQPESASTIASLCVTSVQELCEGGGGRRRVVPLPSLRFEDAFLTCRAMGGFINLPTSLQDIEKDLDVFRRNEECERQWAGITDVGQEGLWRDPFYDLNFPTANLLFRRNNPDGDRYQNCIRLHDEGLEDTECGKSSCSACRVPARATWTLRGVCEEEERMNYLDLVPQPLGFRGYGEYAIRPINGVWTWFDSVENITMAKFLPDKTQLNYPLGRQHWKLTSEVCEKPPGSLLELTLSSCVPGEFTCTDGKCVSFSSRCDLKFDCDDKTDESNCDIVNFPDDYRKILPPRPQSDSALPISVNVSIDTLNVNTQTMMLSASYNLRMTWYDNRLSYNNLKKLTRLNTLPEEQVQALWRPLLGYINTDDIQQTAVDTDSVTTIVKPVDEFQGDLTNSYEVEIYSGDKNPISTTRKYFTIYTCNFDLTLYPFDIQECFMQLQILSASNEYLIFDKNGSNVEYLGPKFLVEYGIGRIALEVENQHQYTIARVTVELIRRYGYAMLNIYIPSVTLLIISCITLFFRPPIFEVRVMTSLTALLVLATLFTQVSASLPKTSYFKMVDIWLLFCIIIIFLIIIFHTIIDNFVEYDGNSNRVVTMSWVNKEEPKTIKEIIRTGTGGIVKNKLTLAIFLSRLVIFSLFSLFNIVYWGTLGVSSGLVYQYQ